MEKQRLVVLGSTGSIGQSTLNLVRRFPEKFEVVALAAGSNHKLLAEQAQEFNPQVVALAEVSSAHSIPGDILVGPDSAVKILDRCDFDTVVGAIVGIAGLASSYRAVSLGKRLLLANKESLVCAGELLMQIAGQSGADLVPVDSEHSAMAQLLELSRRQEVRALTLTASGGPFYDLSRQQLTSVTPQQAVKHPRWNMGAKISVDSSTLMNKALELIEAYWLFNVPQTALEVLVHRQSIVHALITFHDEVQIAHLSVPDMQGPISFALMRPQDRLPQALEPLDLAKLGKLTFEALDSERFRSVEIARRSIEVGGTAAAILNAANEVAVECFLAGSIGWLDIVPMVEKALDHFSVRSYSDIEEIIATHQEVVRYLYEFKPYTRYII